MKSKTLPEQSTLMNKWSSQPTERNATRVRDNQRRHRARVKSRMEDLEARLQETNSKLEAALSTIRGLTAEVEAFRARQSSTTSHLGLPRSSEYASPVLDHDPRYSWMKETSPGRFSGIIEEGAPKPEAPTQDAEVAVSARTTVENDAVCDCPGGAPPPPALGESTMSCSSAFQIIEQQNYGSVEVTKIKAWLAPGFRLKPGEACRVETNRLYELLDHITSSS